MHKEENVYYTNHKKGFESMNIKLWIICIFIILSGCSKHVEKIGNGVFQNENGEKITAKIQVVDDQLTKVYLDETIKDKKETKKDLGDAYHMKIASRIGKEWDEQIRFLENYIVEHGIDSIQLNEEGKPKNTDVLTGCTIRIDGFIEAVKDAYMHLKEK